jgi:carboxypeptidase PM20D1
MMVGVAEKGYMTLKVVAPAVGGHSSTPPEAKDIGSINLAKALIAINEKQFPLELRGPAAAMLDVLGNKAGSATRMAVANKWLFATTLKQGFAESPASAAMLHTTIAPTMLKGSPKENVLPQDATALINFRIAPWDSSQGVLEHTRKAVAGLPVKVGFTERVPREPSPVSSSQSLGWKLIYAAGRADHPGIVATPYLVVGGTDSRHMRTVSDDVYRFQAMTFDLEGVKLIHGTNEHITVKNLESSIRFFTRLIATAAG